jgi:hypothetical protein
LGLSKKNPRKLSSKDHTDTRQASPAPAVRAAGAFCYRMPFDFWAV